MEARQNEQQKAATIKKTSSVLVGVLTVVTGGLYIPFWFLTRLTAINALQSEEKLRPWIFYMLAAGFALMYALGVYSVVTHSAALLQGKPTVMVFNAVDIISNLFSLFVLVVAVIQSLKVKRILHDHFTAALRHTFTFSTVWTVSFLNIYLQYKINRLPA